jgi:NAD-dependent deacetylase
VRIIHFRQSGNFKVNKIYDTMVKVMKMKLVALTGAGISKASGIPTFEELGDLREKLSRDFYRNYPEDFYRILYELKTACINAQPNPAHIALAQCNVPIITMNIDGLHGKAGSKNVIEIHGTMEKVYCHSCLKEYDFNIVAETIKCPACRELLDTYVVLYGDQIPRYYDAVNLVMNAEELLIIGTSFYTSTANVLADQAKYAGAKITLINHDAETEVPKYLKQTLLDSAGS